MINQSPDPKYPDLDPAAALVRYQELRSKPWYGTACPCCDQHGLKPAGRNRAYCPNCGQYCKADTFIDRPTCPTCGHKATRERIYKGRRRWRCRRPECPTKTFYFPEHEHV